MKILQLLFVFALLSLASCKDDDPVLPDNQTLLHLDGNNATGPVLDPGEYEMAAFFPASEMAGHVGKKLIQIQFFAGQAPESVSVKAYGKGTANEPGATLYEADVTNGLKTPSWNNHTLATPLTITGEDMWLVVAFKHTVKQQSIGCDSGPNKAGGDWLYQSSDGDWKTFKERTTTENVNWNIRGLLEE